MTEDISPAHNGQIQAFVERIERVSEEITGLQGDLKDIYTELKSSGFDAKIVRKLIAMRKKDPAKLQEEQAILDLYIGALGMLSDLPLGKAAVERTFGRAAP